MRNPVRIRTGVRIVKQPSTPAEMGDVMSPDVR